MKQEPSKKSNLTIDKMFEKVEGKNSNKVSEATTKVNDERNDQGNNMKPSLERKRTQTHDSSSDFSSGEDEIQPKSQSNTVASYFENENSNNPQETSDVTSTGEKSNFRSLEKMEKW